MNRKLIGYILGLLCSFGVTIASAEVSKFTLKECYDRALKESQDLQARESDLKVSKAKYRQAVAVLLPKIHFVTTEKLQDSASGFSNSSSFDNSGSTNNTRSKDRLQSSINIKQPIFSGFRDFALTRAAKAEMRAEKLDRVRAEQTLRQDVANLFYQILMYDGDRKILAKSAGALRERVDDLDHRVSLGKSRSSEVLAAKDELANIGVTDAQLESLLNASRDAMAFFLNMNPSDIQLMNEAKSKKKLLEPLDSYLPALADRPDLQAVDLRLESSRNQLIAAKGAYWPTITFEGNSYIEEHPNTNQDWDALFRFDLPLFEGGAIRDQVSAAEATYSSEQYRATDAKRRANQELQTAYDKVSAKYREIVELGKLRLVAKENYDSQKHDYELGTVTNLEVLQALKHSYDTERLKFDSEQELAALTVALEVTAGRIQ